MCSFSIPIYIYIKPKSHFHKKTRQRHHVPLCLLHTYMQTYIFYVGRYGSALLNVVIRTDIHIDIRYLLCLCLRPAYIQSYICREFRHGSPLNPKHVLARPLCFMNAQFKYIYSLPLSHESCRPSRLSTIYIHRYIYTDIHNYIGTYIRS